MVLLSGTYVGADGPRRGSVRLSMDGWSQETPLEPNGYVEFIVPASDDLVRVEENLDDGPKGTIYYVPALTGQDIDLTQAPVPSAGLPSIIGDTLEAVLPTLVQVDQVGVPGGVVPMDLIGAPDGIAQLNSAAHVPPAAIVGFSPLTASGFLAARKELRPVTGSRSSGAALQSLLTQLAALGLISDGTVA